MGRQGSAKRDAVSHAGGAGGAFKPTEEQRQLVRLMAACGIPEADIARVTINGQTKRPIDAKTLRKHFRSELDTGALSATVQVAGKLFQSAMNGNTAAQIFWLKARAGWREISVTELGGRNGSALTVTHRGEVVTYLPSNDRRVAPPAPANDAPQAEREEAAA